jgi:uncharacterized membrane protein
MTNQPFFYPAAIIGAMSLVLIFGWVPRNRIFGVRTVKTFASDESWYRANRFGGVLFLGASVVYLAFANFIPMADRHDPQFTRWLAHLAGFVVPILAGFGLLRRRLRQL